MLELIKKFAGVTYDVKGLTEPELNEIIYSLEAYERRNQSYYFDLGPSDTLADKLRKLMNDK